MDEQEAIFIKILAQTPDDWKTRRIYADYLEEIGKTALARAQHWMAENQRYPRWSRETKTYDWWNFESNAYIDSLIEKPIYDKLLSHTHGSNWKGWSTLHEAEVALAVALALMEALS